MSPNNIGGGTQQELSAAPTVARQFCKLQRGWRCNQGPLAAVGLMIGLSIFASVLVIDHYAE